MKIRGDFVTNSSSSSFVTITLAFEDGNEIYGECYKDTGWGTSFIDTSKHPDTKLSEVLTGAECGADIIRLLNEMDIYTEFDTPQFDAKVNAISDTSILTVLSIEENVDYEGSFETTTRKYTFSFQDKQGVGSWDSGINSDRIYLLDSISEEVLFRGGVLNIPSNICEIDAAELRETGYRKINIAPDNPNFYIKDNDIYSISDDSLIYKNPYIATYHRIKYDDLLYLELPEEYYEQFDQEDQSKLIISVSECNNRSEHMHCVISHIDSFSEVGFCPYIEKKFEFRKSFVLGESPKTVVGSVMVSLNLSLFTVDVPMVIAAIDSGDDSGYLLQMLYFNMETGVIDFDYLWDYLEQILNSLCYKNKQIFNVSSSYLKIELL